MPHSIPERPQTGSIKANFAKSSGWGMLGTGADNLIQFIIFAVLARILDVAELGIVAFAIVLIDLCSVFVLGGLPEALIRAPRWEHHVASVCFTINMLMALFFSACLTIAGFTVIQQGYGPGSGAVIAALSLIFVIDASRAVHVAKLRREFNYKNLAVRGTIAGITAGAGSIWMATAGFGVWALVFQRLCYVSIMTLATWVSARFVPRLSLSRSVIAELSHFGIRATFSRLLEIANLRITDLVVGVFFGPVPVALYRVGGRGLDAMRRLFVRPIQDAAFSALSRLEGAHAIGRAYHRVSRAGALVTFPMFIGLAVIAPDFTVLLFGEKYTQSGLIMAILALGGLPAMMTLFTTAALMAAGEAHVALRVNVMTALSNLVFTLAFVPLGPVGAAAGNCFAQFAVVPYNLAQMHRSLHFSWRTAIGGLMAPLLAALAMGAVLWGTSRYLLSGLSPTLSILLLLPLGAIIYLLALLTGGRRYLQEMMLELRPLLPARLRRG